MNFKTKRLEHELFHAEKSASHALETMKNISNSLHDAQLSGHGEEIESLLEKIAKQAENIYHRLTARNPPAGGRK